MTEPHDSVLGRIAAGDASAMEECLDRYGGLVWSLARRLSLSHADAEDAVQDVFIELWRLADRYDGVIASEPTFIATIARRRLIDRRRRLERDPATASLTFAADSTAAPQSTSPPDWMQICEEAAIARRSMAELSPEQQQVLTLAIDDGCSQMEISRRLDLPLGTVKTHARRGLLRLRELLTSQRAPRQSAGGVQ